MTDQTTTIAALPAGYATIAGMLYAIMAIPPRVWSHTAWSKMSRFLPQKLVYDEFEARQRVHPDYGPEETTRFSYSTAGSTGLITLCSVFSRVVTREIGRVRSPGPGDLVVQHIAALHLLVSTLMAQGKYPSEQSRANDPESGTSRISDGYREEDMPLAEQIIPAPQGLANNQFPKFTVNIIEHHGEVRSHDVVLTPFLLQELTEKAFDISDSSTPLDVAIISQLAHHSQSPGFATTVCAQRAGNFDVFLIEVGYKFVEFLFSSGIVLGSTGGAWLGLTLGSVFPQRIAAGVYASSFGQALPRDKFDMVETKEYIFIPAGTVWTENGYCVAPCLRSTWLEDQRRNALGFWVQYILLSIVQNFKRPIRSALEFGSYLYTRDAVRYVLLIIELFVVLTVTSSLWRKRQISRATLPAVKCKWSLRTAIAPCTYSVMLSAALCCVILGQHDWLKPLWKFYEVSRIVDPIAAIGAVAVPHIGIGGDGSIMAEHWALIWAIGACTVVW